MDMGRPARSVAVLVFAHDAARRAASWHFSPDDVALSAPRGSSFKHAPDRDHGEVLLASSRPPLYAEVRADPQSPEHARDASSP